MMGNILPVTGWSKSVQMCDNWTYNTVLVYQKAWSS